jgi:hypothetical protein
MSVDKSQLDRVIDSVERYLMENKDKMIDAYIKGKDCYDITNPLEAPNNAPFSDGAPQRIHGQPRRDLFS